MPHEKRVTTLPHTADYQNTDSPLRVDLADGTELYICAGFGAKHRDEPTSFLEVALAPASTTEWMESEFAQAKQAHESASNANPELEAFHWNSPRQMFGLHIRITHLTVGDLPVLRPRFTRPEAWLNPRMQYTFASPVVDIVRLDRLPNNYTHNQSPSRVELT